MTQSIEDSIEDDPPPLPPMLYGCAPENAAGVWPTECPIPPDPSGS